MSVATVTTERLHIETAVGLRSMAVVRTPSASDTEAAARAIAAMPRTIVTSGRSIAPTAVIARAAALLAETGTITVLSDTATPNALLWQLHDAGHRGNVRLIAAQAGRMPTPADDDVLLVDIDAISWSSDGSQAALTAAARQRRVIITGTQHTSVLDQCVDYLLANSAEPFTLVAL